MIKQTVFESIDIEGAVEDDTHHNSKFVKCKCPPKYNNIVKKLISIKCGDFVLRMKNSE